MQTEALHGDQARRNLFYRLQVLRLPRKQKPRPTATRRAATLSGGSKYCACLTDRSRGPRRPGAEQPFLEAPSTAPATEMMRWWDDETRRWWDMRWWDDEMMRWWDDEMQWWDEMMRWWDDEMMRWWDEICMMEDMTWWDDEMMRWWDDEMREDEMMRWWHDEMMRWWDDDEMQWWDEMRWEDEMMRWWDGEMVRW